MLVEYVRASTGPKPLQPALNQCCVEVEDGRDAEGGMTLLQVRAFLVTAGAVWLGGLLLPTEAQAQSEEVREPRGYVDLTFVGAQPTGEFGAIVERGWGFELGGRYELDPVGLFSLRGSIGLINYGNETLQLCSFYSCRIGVDIDTENNIFFLGVGPELGVQVGPLRPYARASVGLGVFATTSAFSGSDGWPDYSYASTNNSQDVVFKKRVGGGLGIRLSDGPRPVLLDLGVDYHNNGRAKYLREGDIVDQPDGSIVIYPRRTEANLWSFRVGVSVGI